MAQVAVELMTRTSRFASAAPTVGTWQVGDEIKNKAPASGSAILWRCTTAGTFATSAWASSTAYSLGALRSNDGGKVYRVTTAGTSAGSGGPTGTGSSITDGTVTWTYVSPTPVFEAVSPGMQPGQAASALTATGGFYSGSAHGTRAGAALTLDRASFTPMWLDHTTTISGLACEVTTGAASSFMRLAIYSDDLTGTWTLLQDTGQLSAVSTGLLAGSISSTTLQPGRYWLAGVNQGVSVSARCITGPGYAIPSATPSGGSALACFTRSSTSGAFPSTISTTLAASSSGAILVWALVT